MKTAAVANRPLSPAERGLPRTYHVVTLGCQMNEHDSERMAGLLDAAGMVPVSSVPEKAARATRAGDGGADVVVLNTCSVRENAANKLYGHLGQLAEVKRERPGMMIAVGGCFAQQEGSGILRRAPWVDAIFGTHNIDMLPVLLRRAELRQEAAVELEETLKVFPSMLPAHRTSPASAWVSISVGCNNTCTFCIVPSLRGRERDREPEEILRELQAVVAQGAVEVTLLGQNVNSYGNGFGRRGAFAQLLREAGRTPGLERLRFASPHPAAFTEDVIAAMAETPTVMPSLHFPLQSGSDRVLRQMRRSYRVERFLRILGEVRDAIPEAAITTDVIVGFPGETDADFEATLRVMEQARFSAAFTFIYSRRPGTPAADREDQVPSEVVSERYQRLLALQERISTEENERLEGQTVEVLVGEQGTKDRETGRMSGRARDNRLVHFALPPSLSQSDLQKGNGSAITHSGGKLMHPGGEPPMPRPGDFVTVQVTHGAPHHLVADSALAGGRFEVHRTRAGDLWEASQSAPAPGHGIQLGMPGIPVVARRRRVAS
ncbi:(Dimethylallyl)adenosine tRNA methylthiotransferase MiaB [Mobiluncus mulieris]|uniref:tRNA (N6-isopentenyl adenosine(37)-C2)-methylthiotransferase MiaB n=1 Tax=Mobiluncus mulieris TaxID=2052 RepID=UPI00031BA3E5|nr:tRNA (N6-isopentenyl adenosine(37)-C2)-methylthiotransferase MiaB [Mobiluncus mulieris]SPX76122.1 (Dimethylallyl)adenosine tRNA methylthiotransferase MiaB [Mobiluncus mulieris]